MVSTPEGFTDDSNISTMTSTTAKKPLCMFTNILDVKKTATCSVGAAKYKRKAIKYGTTPRALKKSEKVIQKLMNR